MTNLEYEDLKDTLNILKNSDICKSIKFRRLNELSNMLELYKIRDDLKHQFVDGSLNILKKEDYGSWCYYFGQLLEYVENFELLIKIDRDELLKS